MCGTQGGFCPWGLEPAADGAGTQVFCLPCPDTSMGRAVPSTRSPQMLFVKASKARPSIAGC